jgi:Ca-activated chloride channel homolog
MRFVWPEMLWLLLCLPALVGAYVYALRRRKKLVLPYASLMLVRDALRRGHGIRRHIPPALFLAAMGAAIVAMARPSAVVLLPSEYYTLVLAMDVSRSMRATDVQPNRLVAAQQAARSLIEKLPSDVRLGITSFAATAAVVQTPTENRDEMLAAIERFQLQRGTATGSGLLVSLAMLLPEAGIDLESAIFGADFARRARGASPEGRPLAPLQGTKKETRPVPPGSHTAGAIIILSDGRRTTGPDPIEAAKMAADRGVRVYTVGFGTKEGEIPGFEGYSYFARLDEETLKSIASITRGEYYFAGSAADLQKVYQNLNTRITLERRETEVSALFSAAAALLVILAALLSLLWFQRAS